MALTVDATSTSNGASVSSLTWSHTCTGSDLVLVVTVGVFGGQTVTGVTYNGVALTQVGTDIQGSYNLSDIWKLTSPATGANNIVVSLSGTADAIRAGGISFAGASGTVDGFASSKGAAAGSTVNASVNVTSKTSNKVVGICLSQLNTSNFTIGAGQSSIFEIEGGVRPCASSYEDGAVTTAFGYTINSTVAGENYIIAGANVEAKRTTVFKDNFTGSTINTAIWNETDPDGVISQNNVLNLDCEASTNRNIFYNKLQSVATVTAGVACVQGKLTWTGNSANEPFAGIFLYVDDNNFAAIGTRTTPGGKLKLFVQTGGGGFEYANEPDIVKDKDVKITYDIASHDIKFYYWNGSAWAQMGTTQNADLGSTVYYCISGVIGTTPAKGVDPLIVDDAYFFTTDTSDHYPPTPPVTLNTTNFFF